MATILTAAACWSGLIFAQSKPVEELKPRYRALAASITARDLAALTSLYVPDASLEMRTPQAHDRVQGEEGIAAQWQSTLRAGVVSFDATITDAQVAGGAISEKGTFLMKRKDKSVYARGNYTATWRKDAGVWKLVKHAFVAE
jgi:ketosteroid isomerase-like protein